MCSCMTLVVLYNDFAYSFRKVGQLIAKYLAYYDEVYYAPLYLASISPINRARAVVVVDDCFSGLESPITRMVASQKPTILWCDTWHMPAQPTHYTTPKNLYVVATSRWNAEILGDLGVPIHDIVPRPIDDAARKIAPKPTPTVLFVGTDVSYRGRKGIDIVDKVMQVIAKEDPSIRRICIVNYTLASCDRHRYGSIKEVDLLELMAQSVLIWPSRAEGFGMPVAENMAVSTRLVYSDVPAHNEFARGIPIKPISEGVKPSSVRVGFIMPWYEFDIMEFAEAAIKAAHAFFDPAIREYALENFLGTHVAYKLLKIIDVIATERETTKKVAVTAR
mgnify:CR=1 FL=1